MFEYELKNGIGVLLNPTIIDMAVTKIIEFKLPIECGTLKIGAVSFDIQNYKAKVPNSRLTKGSNLVKIITADKTIPCQPLRVFVSNDKLECTLACAVDTQETLTKMVEVVNGLNDRLTKIENINLQEMQDKINLLITITNDLQERVLGLEKNYDPTEINN